MANKHSCIICSMFPARRTAFILLMLFSLKYGRSRMNTDFQHPCSFKYPVWFVPLNFRRTLALLFVLCTVVKNCILSWKNLEAPYSAYTIHGQEEQYSYWLSTKYGGKQNPIQILNPYSLKYHKLNCPVNSVTFYFFQLGGVKIFVLPSR